MKQQEQHTADGAGSSAPRPQGTSVGIAVPPDFQGSVGGKPRRDTADVGQALSDAIHINIAEDDGRKLTRALAATIEASVKTAVQREPKAFADALFPVIGPAIRKAIAEAFRTMVQQMNKGLDYNLSKEGLRWRLEALWTGKSLAEVVLYHTLVYRVEQVFLIHREQGLLLQHVVATAVESSSNPDLVSSMLTAIQDFVKDSFESRAASTLQSVEVGDLTVWMEQGPRATLAAVIRGAPPVELRAQLQQTLETVHTEFGEALARFEGDVAAFEFARPLLESCLVAHQRRPQKSIPALVTLAVLLLLAAGSFLYFDLRDRMRWNAYFQRLDSEPGIVVSEISRHGGRYRLTGLRDPLAADPDELLRQAGMEAERLTSRWEPYQSLAPEVILRRARKVLNPPDSVRLTMDRSILTASGAAPRSWIRDAKILARALPGIAAFETRGLVDLDRTRSELLLWEAKKKDLAQVTTRLEATSLPDNAIGGALPNSLVDDIAKLLDLARFLDVDVLVRVTGRAARRADGSADLDAARQCSERVVQGLTAGGIDPVRLKATVETAPAAEGATVGFKVVAGSASD